MRTEVLLLIAALVAGAIALSLAAAWRDSLKLTNPDGYTHPLPAGFRFDATPTSALGLPFEDIEIQAANGEHVRGWLIPAAQDALDLAVVMLHGRGGNRTTLMPHARIAHDVGAAVALIDLRENGLSDGAGRGTALAMREAEDGLLTTEAMRRRGYPKVVLFGCSLGASAAILAAARDPKINGVIAEGTLQSFDAYFADVGAARLARLGLKARWLAAAWGRAVVFVTQVRLNLRPLERPIDRIEVIAPRPVLLIHGAQDAEVPAAHARNLAGSSGDNVDLWVIEGVGHCNGNEFAPAPYATRVREFLKMVMNRQE
jgi:pimeloyl-ACP methyl ester carboxylesterase